MKQRSTDAFAFVLPWAEDTISSEDAFIATLTAGLRAEFARAGKMLALILAPDTESHSRMAQYLADGPDPEGYLRIAQYVIDGHIAGVVVPPTHLDNSLPRALVEAGVPLVSVGRPPSKMKIPFVDVDHRGAVTEAVTYLLESGRSNVVTIAGPQGIFASVERLDGYLAAMKKAGAEPVVAYGDFTRAGGAMRMHEMLDGGTTVDAVFAASDLMALGAIHLLKQGGIRVPEDVAVIGFDDIHVAQYSDPPLTTIRQPVHEFGVTAARQLLRMAAGEEVEDVVLLPTEFVVRESA